jgi:hypothetical protein
MRGVLLAVACLAGAPQGDLWAARAGDGERAAEELYRQALAAHDRAAFEQSLKLLGRARARATTPSLLARIYLLIGVTCAIMENEEAARPAFREALLRDPCLTPDPSGLKPSVMTLFRAVREQLRGEVVVTADQAEASVLVDGRPAGHAPLRLSLAVGAHQVEVRGVAGNGRHSGQVLVRAGERTTVAARLGSGSRHRQPRPKIWTWVGAGASALSLIVGIGLGASAQTDYQEYRDDRTDWERGQKLASSIRDKSTAANAMFVVAGALAVASVILFFYEERLGRDTRWARSLLPTLGRTGDASLSLSF